MGTMFWFEALLECNEFKNEFLLNAISRLLGFSVDRTSEDGSRCKDSDDFSVGDGLAARRADSWKVNDFFSAVGRFNNENEG